MKNSKIETIASISPEMEKFKKQFPNAVWSISEPVFEKWRKANKDREALPFSIYLATDDLIGTPSHQFAVVECDNIAEGLIRAVEMLITKISEQKSKS